MGMGCAVSVLATALNSIGRQRTVAMISLAGGGVQVCCTFFLTALPGVEMGGFVCGALAAAVLELALPLLRHLTALAREVLEWV
jgi:O-antigen/teichoic acid export membrane protein